MPPRADGDAMLARMEHAAAQLAKKETTEKTAAAIRADMDRLREGLPLGGMDRYLAAAYPTAVCAADYLPEGSIVLVCEGSRVMERAKGCAFEWGEDLKILLEEGVLAGQFASLTVELEDLTRRLRGSFPLLLCDSLPTSALSGPAAAMLSINARRCRPTAAALRPPPRTWSTILPRAAACWCSAATKRARGIFTAFWRSAVCAHGSISPIRRCPPRARPSSASAR